MTDRPDSYLRLAGATTVLAAATLLVLMIVDGDSTLAIGFVAAGLLAATAASIVSSLEWPLNEEVKAWGDAPDLERYAELRRLWDVRHARRTWLNVLALVAFVIAIVASESA